jgi:hypothetical protein
MDIVQNATPTQLSLDATTIHDAPQATPTAPGPG